MATTKKQRVGILIIMIAMVVGTIGMFVTMVLATQNEADESQRQQKVISDYQAKVQAQSKELSETYYPILSSYSSRVGEFERDGVDEIKTEDLKEGDGAVIDDTTKFAAYYIGWNPKGVIFDQSIDGSSLKEPLYENVGLNYGLAQASLIEGWKQGMRGMKIGGVREITLPSDLAYGEMGSGDDIPPNTPIRFVVLAIPAFEPVPLPEFN